MYVPHSPHTYCASGHGGDGIFSFFTKLFPRVLSKAVIKPALKTAIAAGKTIAKKTLKTAAKEGISLAKEGVKQGLSEAAKYGIEKATEGIDKLAQKAVDKGVSEKTTHFISQNLKIRPKVQLNHLQKMLQKRFIQVSTIFLIHID